MLPIYLIFIWILLDTSSQSARIRVFYKSKKRLKESSFVRIHKSFLVNVNYIVNYKKGKGGSVVLSNGKELSVSSSKKGAFLAFFK